MTIVDAILWIVFGALVGWISSIIMRTDEEQGALANVVVGVLGAIIGGWIGSLLGFATTGSFTLGGLILAVVGAVVLIALIRMFRRTT